MSRADAGYALVTAFRNESGWLPDLVATVAAQTLPPTRWVLVDDGSTDDSLGRARALTDPLPFAEVVAMTDTGSRSFASQVYAQLAGVERLSAARPAYLGFLDADILLPPEYYEAVLERFATDPALGVAGGRLLDRIDGSLVDVRSGSHGYHVPGGVQLFRTECYHEAGGYRPIAGGGQDVVIETTAMMNGWRVHSFAHPEAVHLRPFGSASAGALSRHVAWGRKFYTIGYHPLYFAAATARRVAEAPFGVSAGAKIAGYLGALVTRTPRAVSPEVMTFLRRQQAGRMADLRHRRRGRD